MKRLIDLAMEQTKKSKSLIIRKDCPEDYGLKGQFSFECLGSYNKDVCTACWTQKGGDSVD